MKLSTKYLAISIWVTAHQCYGAWAAHYVLSPASPVSRQKNAPYISVSQRQVTIRLPKSMLSEDSSFFLVTARERLLPEQMELRGVMAAWTIHSRSLENEIKRSRSWWWWRRRLPISYSQSEMAQRLAHIERFEPIKDNSRETDEWIVLTLDMDVAMRSYVVYDFLFIYEESSNSIMDGGLWLTYDIPAYVENLQGQDPTIPPTVP